MCLDDELEGIVFLAHVDSNVIFVIPVAIKINSQKMIDFTLKVCIKDSAEFFFKCFFDFAALTEVKEVVDEETEG